MWSKFFCKSCAPDEAAAVRQMLRLLGTGLAFINRHDGAWLAEVELALRALLAELEDSA